MKIKKVITALLCALLIVPGLAAPAFAASAPWGLILSWNGAPSSTIAAVWRAGDNCGQVFEVSESGDFADAVSFRAEVKDISLDGSGIWLYEAKAYGLKPETYYRCRAGSGSLWQYGSFRTQAEEGSVSFCFFGDIQPEKGREDAVYSAWALLAAKAAELYPRMSFGILAGDIVDSGIDQKQFDAFRLNASTVFSRLPLLAANGNQESNFISGKPELYMDEFSLPENGPEGFEEEFYYLDIGSCRMIVVNGWVLSGEQRIEEKELMRVEAWMKLALISGDSKWQIVVSHIPVYPLHEDSTAERLSLRWAELLERWGADLVLEGHQHVYSRSKPLLNGRPDSKGLVYIMGNSGDKFFYSSDESFAEKVIYGKALCQVVSAGESYLDVVSIDAGGTEADSARIEARSPELRRAELVETLWSCAGCPEPSGSSPFADDGTEAAAWAYENGIAAGYGDGRLGPEDTLMPEHARLMLSRWESYISGGVK